MECNTLRADKSSAFSLPEETHLPRPEDERIAYLAMGFFVLPVSLIVGALPLILSISPPVVIFLLGGLAIALLIFSLFCLYKSMT